MSPAQDLHDKLKAVAEAFAGTPGLAYHLSQLAGCIGHLRLTIKQQARESAAAPALIGVDPAQPGADRTVDATVAVEEPSTKAVDPALAKYAPVVQVARPAK